MLLRRKIDLANADAIKTFLFELRNQLPDSFILWLQETIGKAMLSLIISDQLVQSGKLNATKLSEVFLNTFKVVVADSRFMPLPVVKIYRNWMLQLKKR